MYLDDVLVFASSFNEDLSLLRSVPEAIRSADLTIGPEKGHLRFEKLNFFGHIVRTAGVSLNPKKTTATASFPRPSDKNALRRFFGLFPITDDLCSDFRISPSHIPEL